jgi:aminoglycoside phosphotransferase (APT) family kinase protein
MLHRIDSAWDPVELTLLGRGCTSTCWLVRTTADRLVVKIGTAAAGELQMRRLTRSARIARFAGFPTPAVHHASAASPLNGGASLVVTGYQPGLDMAQWTASDERQRARLLRSIGTLVAQLHAIRSEYFSDFTGVQGRRRAWPDVVELRCREHLDQMVRAGAISAADAGQIDDRVVKLARLVGAETAPVLVHRDLHPPNIIVRDGEAAGLVDFDRARIWDRTCEFFKLRRYVFQNGDEHAFFEGYFGAAEMPASFERSMLLADLVESLAMATYWLKTENEGLVAEVAVIQALARNAGAVIADTRRRG